MTTLHSSVGGHQNVVDVSEKTLFRSVLASSLLICNNPPSLFPYIHLSFLFTLRERERGVLKQPIQDTPSLKCVACSISTVRKYLYFLVWHRSHRAFQRPCPAFDTPPRALGAGRARSVLTPSTLDAVSCFCDFVHIDLFAWAVFLFL